MAHGLGVHSIQLGAAVVVTELVLTLVKLFSRGKVLVGGGQAGDGVLAEITMSRVSTNVLPGHAHSCGEVREENS